MTPTPNDMTVERTGDRELVYRRTLAAGPAAVFDAYTLPEHVRRWWAPTSRNVTMVECTVDLRPGGTYRYVLARGTERFAFSGRYVEISRPTRLVYTQAFEAMPLGEAVITVTFEDHGGRTVFTAHERYPSKEALDAALATGMESGAREAFDLLAALVESLAA